MALTYKKRGVATAIVTTGRSGVRSGAFEAQPAGCPLSYGKIAHVGHGSIARFAALALGSLAIAGCGSTPTDDALSQVQLRAAYRGAPAPLAALFARHNQLLGGGAPAFEHELRALRGYPVVVNTWASWCPDCRQEFSIFQLVAPKFARSVAFVGDDFNDGAGAAWLRRYPLSFPSYADRSKSVDQAIGAATAGYAPVTYFYNRRGREVTFHFGPYLSVASLEHDIRLYLGA
jgi:thiol-disulfide isomerase/thioredoxin